MPPADFLLIDLGNTSAKLRLAGPDRLLGETRRIPTAGLLAAGGGDSLRCSLEGWAFRRAVLSSVVPAAARVVLAALPGTLLIRAGMRGGGVNLEEYPGAATLGADRLANATGALALHGPGPLIVVDFGTAATFNALDGAGRFLGGVIAPGLAAVRDYLPARGAQLPAIDLGQPLERAIGRRTPEAVLAGVVLGFRGMIREIVTSLQAELASGSEEPARVVATGGDAAWAAAALPGTFAVVDADLTLHGLRVLAASVEA